jgi:hypothetical protein
MARQEEVDKVTTLFRHVATTYHENTPVSSDVTPATPEPSSSSYGTGFLVSMLQVDVTDMVLTNAAQTPHERFEDELRRYLRFEGGRGEVSNPLGWWKVRPSLVC